MKSPTVSVIRILDIFPAYSRKLPVSQQLNIAGSWRINDSTIWKTRNPGIPFLPHIYTALFYNNPDHAGNLDSIHDYIG